MGKEARQVFAQARHHNCIFLKNSRRPKSYSCSFLVSSKVPPRQSAPFCACVIVHAASVPATSRNAVKVLHLCRRVNDRFLSTSQFRYPCGRASREVQGHTNVPSLFYGTERRSLVYNAELVLRQRGHIKSCPPAQCERPVPGIQLSSNKSLK
eukprot:scpid47686/ scgid16297/ 